MTELLRTAGEVKDALMMAVSGVTLPRRLALERVVTLRDRCGRCRSLPYLDPATSRLLAAAEWFLIRFDQWRAGGGRPRGGLFELPSSDVDALRDALQVYCREVNPHNPPASRRWADEQREAEALEHFTRRAGGGDWRE